jgi:hypothetical protein
MVQVKEAAESEWPTSREERTTDIDEFKQLTTGFRGRREKEVGKERES